MENFANDGGTFLDLVRSTPGDFKIIPAGRCVRRKLQAGGLHIKVGGKGLKLKYQQRDEPLCVLFGLLSALDLYGDSDAAARLCGRKDEFLSIVAGRFFSTSLYTD